MPHVVGNDDIIAGKTAEVQAQHGIARLVAESLRQEENFSIEAL
jgi:hypothetical protein